MKDSIKRGLLFLLLIVMSVSTGFIADVIITKNDRKNYSLGEEASVLNTITAYSEKYGLPEEMIYTVMRMRSGCKRFYESDGKYGYMALSLDETKQIKDLYEIELTDDMLRNPSYNLLFGVQIISKLYSRFEDKGAVYASLLYGEDSVAEWMLNSAYTDITGRLTSVPKGVGDEFYEYLKTEEKYTKLYFENK